MLSHYRISHAFQTVRMGALISLFYSLCTRTVKLHLYSTILREGTNMIQNLDFCAYSRKKEQI